MAEHSDSSDLKVVLSDFRIAIDLICKAHVDATMALDILARLLHPSAAAAASEEPFPFRIAACESLLASIRDDSLGNPADRAVWSLPCGRYHQFHLRMSVVWVYELWEGPYRSRIASALKQPRREITAP